MPVPKKLFIKKMRERYPELEGAPDDRIYLYGIEKNPNLNVEPWEDVTRTTSKDVNISPSWFDYLDYSIDENSWKFVQKAYNTSLTGMTEQLINGKPRFDLTEYDKQDHLIADIASTALSFFMPVDMISMGLGGGLAVKGAQKASPFLLKGLGKRATADKIAAEALKQEATAIAAGRAMTSGAASRKAMEVVMPKITQAVKSAGSLATFEGSVNYVNARNQGLNRTESLKEAGWGVLHGGLMGASVGAIASGFGAKHKELADIVSKGKNLTLGQKMQKAATSKAGAYGAEVSLFTGSSLAHRTHETGEIPSMEDALYDLTFNAGLILSLKGSHKALDKVLKYATENKDIINDKDLYKGERDSASENIKENIDSSNLDPSSKSNLVSLIDDWNVKVSEKLSEKGIALEEYIATVKTLLPEIKKSKEGDQNTANILGKATRRLLEGIGIMETEREILIRDRKKENLSKFELDQINKRIEDNKKLQKELDDVLSDFNIKAKNESSQATQPHTKEEILRLTDSETGELRGADISKYDINNEQGRLEITRALDRYAEERGKANLKSDPTTQILVEKLEGIDKKIQEQPDPLKAFAEQNLDLNKDLTTTTKSGKEVVLSEGSAKEGTKTSAKDYINKANLTDNTKKRIYLGVKEFFPRSDGKFSDLKAVVKFGEWLNKKGIRFGENTGRDYKKYLEDTGQWENRNRISTSLVKFFGGSHDRANMPIDAKQGYAGKYMDRDRHVLKIDWKDVEAGAATRITPQDKIKVTKTLKTTKDFNVSKNKNISPDTTKGLIETIYKIPRRINEMLQLKSKDIDTNTGNVTFAGSKNSKKVTINIKDLDKTLWNAIAKLKKGKKADDFIFQFKEKGAINDKAVNKLLSSLVSDSKIEPISIRGGKKFTSHNFRHSIATDAETILRTTGKDYVDLVHQVLLGHKKDKLTRTHYTEDAFKPSEINKLLKEFYKERNKIKESKDIDTTKASERMLEHKDIDIVSEKQFETPQDPKLKLDKVTIEELESRNKGLGKVLTKYASKNKGNETYVGQFVDGAISVILEKGGNIHTFFHENGHRLTSFLTEVGDTKSLKEIARASNSFANWAMKNDKDKWNSYYMEKYKTKEKAGLEYFLDRMADIASKRQVDKGLMNRITQHGKLIFSKIKNFLGFGSKKDLARIYGEKVYKGFSTEGLNLKGKEFKQSERIKKEKMDLRKDIRDIVNKTGIPKELVSLAAKKVGATSKEGQLVRLRNIKDPELLSKILDFVKNVSPEGKKIPKRSKTMLRTMVDVHDINIRKGVSPKELRDTLKAMGVKDGFMYNASKRTLQNYIGIVKESREDAKRAPSTVDIFVAMENKDKAFAAVPTRKVLMLPILEVLNRYGGKLGQKLSKKMLNHALLEDSYYGKSDSVMMNIEKLISKKEINNQLYLGLDSQRKKWLIKNNMLTGKDKIFLKKLENKNSNQSKAVKMYNDLMNFYWKSIEKEASRWNNKAELEILKANLEKKFIKDYFSRRLTRKALRIISENKEKYLHKNLQKDFKIAMENMVKKEYKKSGQDLKDPLVQSKMAQEVIKKMANNKLKDEFWNDMWLSMQYQTTDKVRNSFMMDRVSYVGEYIKDSKGRMVRAYETNHGLVGDAYARKMSKYLASIRYFPDFIRDIGGEHTLKDTNSALAKLSTLRNDGLGRYAEKSVKRLLGMYEESFNDTIMEGLNTVGRYSAVAGLSSPLSGVKNSFLGITQIFGVTGLRRTLYGISKIFDKEAHQYVANIGGRSTGTRYLNLTGPLEKIFSFNLMQQTEAWNRIASVYAMKLYYNDMLSSLQGKSSGLFSKKKRKFAENEFLKVIDKDDLSFLKVFDEGIANKMAQKRYDKLWERIDQLSHRRLQGSSGIEAMPLWFSKAEIKPFTLFQRMAYAATWNGYGNYIESAVKYNNFMPLLRYGAGSYLTGASLFYIYDKLLGIEPPKTKDESSKGVLSNIMMNLWKAEFLGLFTETLNLYKPDVVATPLQTPVIARHMQNAGKNTIQWWTGSKTFLGASWDFTKQYAVVIGQAEKYLQKSTQPYVSNVRRINTLKRVFLEEKGWSKPRTESLGSNRLPYYTKFKADFAKGGEDMYRSYFAAYNFIVTDWLDNSGNTNPSRKHYIEAHKQARSLLQSQITNLNPMSLSRETDKVGRDVSAMNQFINWLDDDNIKLLKKLEKEYYFKVRQLDKQVAKRYKKSGTIPYKFVY